MAFTSPVRRPFAQAGDDHDSFAGPAARVGLGEAITKGRGQEEWLRWLWEETGKTALSEGVGLPSFEAFRRAGFFQVPDANNRRGLFHKFATDPENNPLNTDGSRSEITCPRIAAMPLPDCAGHPAWMPLFEGAKAVSGVMLHLVSPQPWTRLHDQLDSGNTSKSAKPNDRGPCRIHPNTAKRPGIKKRRSHHPGGCPGRRPRGGGP